MPQAVTLFYILYTAQAWMETFARQNHSLTDSTLFKNTQICTNFFHGVYVSVCEKKESERVSEKTRHIEKLVTCEVHKNTIDRWQTFSTTKQWCHVVVIANWCRGGDIRKEKLTFFPGVLRITVNIEKKSVFCRGRLLQRTNSSNWCYQKLFDVWQKCRSKNRDKEKCADTCLDVWSG